MIQIKAKDTKNTVHKNVGLLGLRLSTIVLIVKKRLSLVSRLIKSIVTKNVGINTTEKDLRDTIHPIGREEKPKKTSVSEHHRLLESGVKRCMKEIITSAKSVVEEAKVVIELSYTHITLSLYQNIQTLFLKLIMGKHYVLSVTEKQIVGATISDPKYCDVIRKRYHKFITGSKEGWQKATK